MYAILLVSALIGLVKMNALKDALDEIISCIDEIFCFKAITNWYIPFESQIFLNLTKNLTETAGISGGILFAIKRESNKPITGSEKKINILISKLIEEKLSTDFLLKYSMSVSWLFLLGSFNHSIPKHTIFFSRTKFHLNKSKLHDSQCMKLSIDLTCKLQALINEFLNNCKEDNKTFFEIIEETKKSEEGLKTMKDRNEAHVKNLINQIDDEKDDAKKQILESNLNTWTEKIEKNNNDLLVLQTERKDIDEKLYNTMLFISNEIEQIKNDREFKELKNLNRNIQIDNFNKIMGIMRNCYDSSMNIVHDASSNGISFD
jgi:hypothetical protein